MLDTASNGSFLAKRVDEAMELVENLAQSDGTYNDDFDRATRANSDFEEQKRSKEMKSLSDKMDKQTLLMNEKIDKLLSSTQKQVHFVGDYEHNQGYQEEVVIEPTQEEMNYVGNQNFQGGFQKGGFTQNYRNHPNLSYQNPNVENPQHQVYPNQATHAQGGQANTSTPPQGFVVRNQFQGGFQPKAPQGFQQSFQPQATAPNPQAMDLNGMFQQLLQGQTVITNNYQDLQSKIATLSAKIHQLESNETSTSRPQGQLPGKAIVNPKEYVQSIELRCGKVVPSTTIPPTINEDVEIQEEGVELQKDNELPKVVRLENKGKRVEIVAKGTRVVEPPKEKPKVVAKPKLTSEQKFFGLPYYMPKMPFLGRFKKQILEHYRAEFDKSMAKVELTMPLVDAFVLVPQYSKYLKEAVAERKREIEETRPKAQEVSSIAHKIVVPKVHEDPGSFTLPIELGPLSFDKCLCDLGASVSLMPLSVAKRMGFTKYKACNISLILADRSIRTPVGKLEDLPISVGKYVIPTDFVVLEMEEEPKDPLIFGRPFLANAGAIIDVRNGKIDLHLSKDEVLHFNIHKKIMRPTIDGQCFSIIENDEIEASPLKKPILKDNLQVVGEGEKNSVLTQEGLSVVAQEKDQVLMDVAVASKREPSKVEVLVEKGCLGSVLKEAQGVVSKVKVLIQDGKGLGLVAQGEVHVFLDKVDASNGKPSKVDILVKDGHNLDQGDGSKIDGLKASNGKSSMGKGLKKKKLSKMDFKPRMKELRSWYWKLKRRISVPPDPPFA